MHKVINFIALLLIIIGGLNWLLVGIFDLNLVTYFFHTIPWLEKLTYLLVGISAIYAFSFFKRVCKS